MREEVEKLLAIELSPEDAKEVIVRLAYLLACSHDKEAGYRANAEALARKPEPCPLPKHESPLLVLEDFVCRMAAFGADNQVQEVVLEPGVYEQLHRNVYLARSWMEMPMGESLRVHTQVGTVNVRRAVV